MTLTRWTFVRHGQSTANAGGWYAGHTDAPLSDLGRTQAIAARPRIAALDFDRALTSDLSRAMETARIVLDGRNVPLVVDPALRERSCGDWEGRTIVHLTETGDLDVFHTFDGCPPAGESLRDVAVRALGRLADDARGGHVLVVCHGALMRTVIGVLDDIDRTKLALWKPDNCETVTRDVDEDRLRTIAAALVAGR